MKPEGGTPSSAAKPTRRAAASDRFFGERPARIWAVIAGMATVAALGLGIVEIWPVSPPNQPATRNPPKTTGAELRTVSLAVQRPSTVDADFIGGLESKGKVDTTVVDVTIKNVGDIVIVILGAHFRVWYAKQMENCPQSGGPVTVAAHYSVKIPEQPPEPPFTISRDIRFEVKPGATERLAFSIGPERNNYSSWVPWLYGIDISLQHDESRDRFHLGSVALVAESGRGLENLLNSQPDFTCLARNRELLTGLIKRPAVRSEEVEELHKRYFKLRTPD